MNHKLTLTGDFTSTLLYSSQHYFLNQSEHYSPVDTSGFVVSMAINPDQKLKM